MTGIFQSRVALLDHLVVKGLRKQSLVKYSWDDIEFRLDQLQISDHDQTIFKKFFLSCSDDICLIESCNT